MISYTDSIILLAILEDLYEYVDIPHIFSNLMTTDLNKGLFELIPDLNERDLSTNSLSQGKLKAKIIAKEAGILSGIKRCKRVFEILDPNLNIKTIVEDGKEVSKRDTLIEIEGNSKAILIGERVALNYLSNLSGVATNVNKFVGKISQTGCKILDSRKTIPNLRKFQKEAVMHGGGYNYRDGLWDMVMLKDNHLDMAGDLEKTTSKAKKLYGDKFTIVVETRNLSEVKEALKSRADRIMLDNFELPEIRDALTIIKGKKETEVSGGVNLDNILPIALTGVDYISIGGQLTMSAPALDLSMIICK
jgi:nicotinate-nucleotide pyrophosphorylase (carboxylating)